MVDDSPQGEQQHPADAEPNSPPPPGPLDEGASARPTSEVADTPSARAEGSLSPWCRIDDEGRIHQQGSEVLDNRVVGRLEGRAPHVALAFFEERFKLLERNVEELEEQFRAAENKGKFSERTERLIARVRTADAIGDFDGLMRRLTNLRGAVRAYQDAMRERKASLCEQAEALADSTAWAATTDKLRALQAEWKTLGSSTRADDEALWARFRGAMDVFFARRDEDRARRQQERESARRLKEELCARAEALAESSDWEATARLQEELMEGWKKAGWAGKGPDEALWERFRTARAAFFDRRRAHRSQRKEELESNYRRKDELCKAAEALVDSDDLPAACEEAKQLQARWKAIGPVPRAVSETQWKRFRAACDQLFRRAQGQRGRGGGRPRQRDERRTPPGGSRKREQAEQIREAIARDRGNLARWKSAIEGFAGASASLRGGLEEKIREVESQLARQEEQLAALEEEIRNER
ncbi:MAG: DUF349 domain-containing protein [Acidobacteriota bacterium]|nr:DUF349 domain-containing protein [Acidobacteriota bacterium]